MVVNATPRAAFLRCSTSALTIHNDRQDDVLLVQIFTDPDTWYYVKTRDFALTPPNSEDPTSDQVAIISCECKAFINSEATCKHMFLASRISSYPVRRYTTNIPVLRAQQPPNATSVAEVLGEKEASRDRVLQEPKKISSLADKFTATDLGDIT